jgi:hypothetical protein
MTGTVVKVMAAAVEVKIIGLLELSKLGLYSSFTVLLQL